MTPLEPAFADLPFSASRTVSWIHIGDTHLTRSGEQNEIDLGRIVDEINKAYANGGVDFVFVPGDIADDGSVVAYEQFRKHLDRLKLPWFGIVGDHDVHEKSFDNFRRFVAADLYGAFSIGPYRFLRLNAFSVPRPDSFAVDDEQRAWLERELQQAKDNGQKTVLFLHCYPSDLKQGGPEITSLLHRYPVMLVDMGHTHYNEVSNDGQVLYSATRSTGQIEEGPVGYSLITLDGDCVSWHFVPLGAPARAVITQPTDERLLTGHSQCGSSAKTLLVRAKVWSLSPVQHAHASISGRSTQLVSEDGLLWRGEVNVAALDDGTYPLHLVMTTQDGQELTDTVHVLLGKPSTRSIQPVDQENAIGAWEERGLLGTQLGPNKNGRKW